MTEEKKRECLVDIVVIAIKSDTKKEFIRKRDLYLKELLSACSPTLSVYAKEQAEILSYLSEVPSGLIKYLEDNLWVDVLYKQREKIEIYETAKKLFAEYEAQQES